MSLSASISSYCTESMFVHCSLEHKTLSALHGISYTFQCYMHAEKGVKGWGRGYYNIKGWGRG